MPSQIYDLVNKDVEGLGERANPVLSTILLDSNKAFEWVNIPTLF